MSRRIVTGFVLVLAMLATSCASKPPSGYREPPTFPVAERLIVELRIPGVGLDVFVPRTVGVGFDPLSNAIVTIAIAGIDAERRRRATNRIQALRDLMADREYRDVVQAAMTRVLDASQLASEFEIEVLHARQEHSANARELKSRTNLLVIEQHYYLTADFKRLRFETYARMGDRFNVKRKLNPRWTRTLYWNIVMFDIVIPEIARLDHADDRAAAWLALGLDGLDTLLREGFDGAAELLAYELAGAQDEVRLRETGRPSHDNRGLLLFERVVRDDGRRRWVRNSSTKFLRSEPSFCRVDC